MLIRRYEDFGRPLIAFELNNDGSVEWTRAQPNHIGFFQLQTGQIECTFTKKSQPLPAGVDFGDSSWQIYNNHSLYDAELSQLSSGLSYRLAVLFGMAQNSTIQLNVRHQAVPCADGTLGTEGSGSESHGSGDSRAAAQPSAFQILRVGGDADAAQAAALGSHMDDVEQKCGTPLRCAGGLGPQSPGEGPATAEASGRASGGASGGRSPMATPASGAASPTATPSSGARFEVDANGVVRAKRQKTAEETIAEDNSEKDNSKEGRTDKEIADAAEETIAEDNCTQEIADKEVADAAL
jgi:hypothetical protein